MEGQRQLIRPDLARRIGRLADQGMVLGDGDRLRAAVYFAGGGLHDLVESQIPRRLEHIQGALNIGVNVGVG